MDPLKAYSHYTPETVRRDQARLQAIRDLQSRIAALEEAIQTLTPKRDELKALYLKSKDLDRSLEEWDPARKVLHPNLKSSTFHHDSEEVLNRKLSAAEEEIEKLETELQSLRKELRNLTHCS